jgi:hypothetical protein
MKPPSGLLRSKLRLDEQLIQGTPVEKTSRRDNGSNTTGIGDIFEGVRIQQREVGRSAG